MANPGLTDDQKAEVLRLVSEHGDISKAARSINMPVNTFRNRYNAAKLDPGIARGMEAVGTNLIPKMAWLKTAPDKEGHSFSIQLVPEKADMIEAVKDAFTGLKPSKPVIAPSQVMADLCTVYPLMDAHIGMRAWGEETGGEDYDVNIARQDMARAFGKVIALTPNSAKAILIIGGDFFHADNDQAETPKSKHKLDVDGRQFRVIDVGIAMVVDVIQRLLERHAGLRVRVLRGNHDENAHMILTFALAERYREEPRVQVEKSPRDLFMFQWGKSAIFAHHGDKAKPQQISMYLSDVCPFWSETKHRHLLTGHVHHDNAKDIGPLRYESLRAFCPPDAYAASMGFGGRRALQAITFHNVDGIVLRALDPISA